MRGAYSEAVTIKYVKILIGTMLNYKIKSEIDFVHHFERLNEN